MDQHTLPQPPAAARAGRGPARLVAVLLGMAPVLLLPAQALAAWTSAGAGSARAASASMPAGPTPTVSVQGRNVTVSWTAKTLSSGAAVTGYSVRRVASDGSTAAIGAGCNTAQTGLSCTESGVAPGTWTCGVTAVLGSWSGTEGTRTTAVVAAPTFTLSKSFVTALPATLTGTVTAYVGPAGLSFRLDDPATGTLLTGTPTSVPTNGGAGVSVTLPAGLSEGTHRVYAVGGGGDALNASVVVDTVPPRPTAVATANGGATAGKIERNDTITVTFSEALQASSLCAAWADDGAAKSLTSGVTVQVQDGGPFSDDRVTAVSVPACSGGFHFGTLDLGAKTYVRGGTTATFGASGTSSSISWNPATSTLTIVLGTASSNTYGTVSSSTIVYTPDAAVTDVHGLAVTGTASGGGQQL
jgi:hypothetical protein